MTIELKRWIRTLNSAGPGDEETCTFRRETAYGRIPHRFTMMPDRVVVFSEISTTRPYPELIHKSVREFLLQLDQTTRHGLSTGNDYFITASTAATPEEILRTPHSVLRHHFLDRPMANLFRVLPAIDALMGGATVTEAFTVWNACAGVDAPFTLQLYRPFAISDGADAGTVAPDA